MNINEILKWFKKAVPNPTVETACVQIGCHYEEVAEMAECLNDKAVNEINETANLYKAKEPSHLMTAEDAKLFNLDVDRLELLDSLCDQIVTATGVAHMLGFDIAGALDEVNRSNWSKFENGSPVFDENGKIKKGESYFKPDLTKFIGGDNAK